MRNSWRYEQPDYTPASAAVDEARSERQRVYAMAEDVRHAHRADCRCEQCLDDIREELRHA